MCALQDESEDVPDRAQFEGRQASIHVATIPWGQDVVQVYGCP